MTNQPLRKALSPALLGIVAMAAVVLPASFGGVSVALAAQPAAPATCSATPVTPGPAVISNWIGGDMNVTLATTAPGCAQSVNATVTMSNGTATLVFPSGTTMYQGLTYSVSGSATIGGELPGICAVWSLTCAITPNTTFTIDASGTETLNGAISCQGIVAFQGSGIVLSGLITTPISGNGQEPSPTATPELGSSALVATGLVPTLLVLYRRRRRDQRHGHNQD